MKTSIKPFLLKDITSSDLSNLSHDWREPEWALELRQAAFKNYQALPMPNEKDEKWKRTGLENLNWDQLLISPTMLSSKPMEIPLEAMERGAQWFSLQEAINSNSDRLKTAWSTAVEKAAQNKFLSLTLALANGGGCLVIPKGMVLKSPLSLPLLTSEANIARFPMNFVFVDEAADVQVWEELTSDQSDNNLVSSYTLLALKENAKASCYNLQNWNNKTWHFQFQDVMQGAFSRFNAVAVSIGGRVFHNETTLHLEGQGAENKVLGVTFGGGEQNFENWITQKHTAIKTVSDIQYRGALKGKARSFFSGLVSITKEAQQSDAYQSAKTLLLSRDAHADAIPNLEILADDVKCSHGAAVGPVDEDQKYYLQARGIPPQEAEEIIIQGFFEPVIMDVPSVTAQEQLRTFIEEKIKYE